MSAMSTPATGKNEKSTGQGSDGSGDVPGTVVDTEDTDDEEEDVPDGTPQVDAAGKPTGKKKKSTKRRSTRKLSSKPQDFQVSLLPEEEVSWSMFMQYRLWLIWKDFHLNIKVDVDPSH